jgi:hypothetical protein
MLLTIGVVVMLSILVFLYWSRTPRHVHEVNLGRMSAQWIAEQRASKSS